MRLRIGEIRLGIDHQAGELQKEAARRLNIPVSSIQALWITHRSVDARRKPHIEFVYTVEVMVPGARQKALRQPGVAAVDTSPDPELVRGNHSLAYPPVVVGAGPAGLFAALQLARWGYQPLLLERGRDVNQRARDVEAFWEEGRLDTASNVQFGEGGAGTFSDGKLTTRIKDTRIRQVLEWMVEAGAPPEIMWMHKPHVGTDRLRQVVVALRRQIIAHGGQVLFQAQVTGMELEDNQVAGVEVNGRIVLPARVVVLAIGHSARDTYGMLYRRGVWLEQKPFAIGLRVEHPQDLIDKAQYGAYAGHPRLGPADYHLTYHSATQARNAFTFCMCPGGYVVAGASEPAMVVTNGMSELARDSGVANSAVVAGVGPADFGDHHPLAGIELQRHWERQAYRLGGSSYRAPAQRVTDFISDQRGELPCLRAYPTYRPGVEPANLRDCLPKEVGETLQEALKAFDRRLKGFTDAGAVLTGVETRTSAPVRITRNAEGVAVETPGLYPAGEGAGYAGGIVSAAVDGLRAAERIIQRYGLPAQEITSGVWERLIEGGCVDGRNVRD